MENSQLKSATEKSQGDIVDIILEDHRPLKKLIKVMKDSEISDLERVASFDEFAPTLISHAKPEEEILYVFMKQNKELKMEACEGDVEHSIADQLVEEIKRTEDMDMKLARIKVLAELVEHHIEEEENELLPEFRKQSERHTRQNLGNEFLKLKLKYLAKGDDNIIEESTRKFNDQFQH